MTRIAVQISPEAKSAYFADYLRVARCELIQVMGDIPVEFLKKGPLEYFVIDEAELDLKTLLKLSFVQGIYAVENDLLRPLERMPDFFLHEDFVFGYKYRGKTNERLTQMLINVGLSTIDSNSSQPVKILDPMCGRGTSLLWAMRYGLEARGIEQDPKALVDIHRNLKKWTKLHRQKHKLTDGVKGGSNKRATGRYLDFCADGVSMRVVTGDARDADQIYKKEKFDLIISDLPYGIHHVTTAKTRNPLAVIEQSVEAWKNCLKKCGAIVLSFNSNNPKRKVLIEAFEMRGMNTLGFTAKHRMSESIMRDVVIFRM